MTGPFRRGLHCSIQRGLHTHLISNHCSPRQDFVVKTSTETFKKFQNWHKKKVIFVKQGQIYANLL